MGYDIATIDAAHEDGGAVHTIDLEGLTLSDLRGKLLELFPPRDEEEEADDALSGPEDIPARVTLMNPQGMAAHLFAPARYTQGKGPLEPVANFEDILKAWSDEMDDDRREAMGEYLDEMGADDLSDFDEAYQGQFASGAAFAEQLADDLGAVSEDNAGWICIDWEATWKCNLRHDYWISDNGHAFRRL